MDGLIGNLWYKTSLSSCTILSDTSQLSCRVIATSLRVYHSFTLFFTALGGDYITVTRTITFLAGETSLDILVRTSEDTVAELTEKFEAQLSNPSVGVVLVGQSRATVDILDNDGKHIQFPL